MSLSLSSVELDPECRRHPCTIPCYGGGFASISALDKQLTEFDSMLLWSYHALCFEPHCTDFSIFLNLCLLQWLNGYSSQYLLLCSDSCLILQGRATWLSWVLVWLQILRCLHITSPQTTRGKTSSEGGQHFTVHKYKGRCTVCTANDGVVICSTGVTPRNTGNYKSELITFLKIKRGKLTTVDK